ncbi:MAG: hypothetical protein ACOX2M_03065 [Fastidiosipilaceae bacterium]|jgi:hypothetical protein
MKKSRGLTLLLLKGAAVLICSVLLLNSLVHHLMVCLPERDPRTLNAVFGQQYVYLRSLDDHEAKVIVCGDSSLAYSFDPDLFALRTGYNTAMMGVYSNLGSVPWEVALTEAKEGDILILAFNYSMWMRDTTINADVLSAFQANPECIWKVFPNRRLELLSNLPQYLDIQYHPSAESENEYGEEMVEGYYSAEVFAEGKLQVHPQECVIADPFEPERYGVYDFSLYMVDEKMIDYVQKFSRRAMLKGVDLLISFPPILDEAVISDEASQIAFGEGIAFDTGVTTISSPADYVFPRVCMYDTIYDCNTDGIERRTRQLADDLNVYLNKK